MSGKALRLYEAQGLLRAERTPAGWRVYGPDQIARLHQVIALKSFGFPLSRIAELLSGGLPDLASFLELHEQVLHQEAKRVDRALRLLSAARDRGHEPDRVRPGAVGGFPPAWRRTGPPGSSCRNRAG